MSDDTENAPRPVRDVEIASTRDGIDITRGYSGPLLVPADRLLRQRGNSDLLLYEQVLSDPKVMSAFRDRQSAVVGKEWQVDAASDRRVDKKAADHVRAQLQRVGFDRVTRLMLFGVFYGVAVSEMLYGVENNLIVWNAIKVRNRRRFRFSSGENAKLRMLTMDNMFEGVELPPAKFWHFATGADNDDEPYGLGLAHWCYWPVLFKRNGIKFWLTFVEKFASPTGVGKFDPNALPAEQQKLLAAVQAIRSDSGIIYPKGMEIDLLEAARSGTGDYKQLHDTMDAAIAQAIVGQTASMQGTPGKLGNDHLQSEVREDLIKADADLICESLNLGPVRWLTQWNFPDADPPRIYRVTEQAENLTARATRDKTIAQIGFRPSLNYIIETYGGDWTPAPPLATDPSSDAAPTPPAEFGAPPAPGADDTPIDAQAQTLAEQAAPAWQAIVERVMQLVAKASDLQSLRDALLALYADLPRDQLGDVMTMAIAAAQLAGRYDVTRDSGGA